MTGATRAGRPLTISLVAGEESGDQLGSALMQALSRQLGDNLRFHGLGGPRMAAAGLPNEFGMGEIAIIGFTTVVRRLPQILSRIRDTAESIVQADPDVLVIIDSPEFTHRVARIVRRRSPWIPIVDFVSPSVWAWRPGRARAMLDYVDHVLAVLPFEPDVYVRLGGPACTYVGHPLIEKVGVLRPAPGERVPLEAAERPVLLVLPGSRFNEIKRHMEPFGEALAGIVARYGPVEAILPAVGHLSAEIRARVRDWPVQPTIVEGEAGKLAGFRRAHAALAASGTVTLELALAGVPMVVAYRVERMLQPFRRLVRVPSVVLANVVMGDIVIPEYLNRDSAPDRLADAVVPLLRPTPARDRQVKAFERLDRLMAFDNGSPTVRAAQLIVDLVRRGAPDAADAVALLATTPLDAGRA